MVRVNSYPVCLYGVLMITRNDSHTLQQTELQMAQEELLNLMTILYISIQTTLSEPIDMAESKKQLRTMAARPPLSCPFTDDNSCSPAKPTLVPPHRDLQAKMG